MVSPAHCRQSGVEGAALDEAKAINLSLTTLGRCIEILSSGKKERPPFRDSKLTRLLSNAIGGAAKTTLIVCVAPTVSDAFETTNSLEFGLQAMKVEVKAKINASTDYNSLTASLMTQRADKEKPIHEMECEVLRELQPKLDQVRSGACVHNTLSCDEGGCRCWTRREAVRGTDILCEGVVYSPRHTHRASSPMRPLRHAAGGPA